MLRACREIGPATSDPWWIPPGARVDRRMASKQNKAASPGKTTVKTSAGKLKTKGDNTRQTSRPADFPIVVIGASAGGLDAMKRFLAAMPADAGIAVVFVPHLDPRHKSLMAELLAKQTPIPVQEARQGTVIRANRVYVIPPNRYLAIKDRKLELSKPPRSRGAQTAIDFALCSAARDERDAAIGVILSGTGNHGVLGVKEIKLAGGAVLVQDPETAEFDQMPSSALRTGVVDHVLPPEGMPDVLVRYAQHWRTSATPETRLTDAAAHGLQHVFALLQARTKHDFRHYRKKMIMRRIQRRMALLQIGDWDSYVDHLQTHEEEVHALFRDLLIGVTSFFRDPEAFQALAERALPKLVARATTDRPVRVWVPGCATGEETYSIAILLMEQFKKADKAASLQIFGTDINERALEIARGGIYPDSIAATLSPERLEQFFVKFDQHHYQVGKSLRESIAFATQNLISDAPFSKVDLISCRNVLIYLEPEVQEKIVSLLHFALNENGYLLLGPSESVGRASGMFAPVAKKWRLFRRIGPARRDLVRIPIVTREEGGPRSAVLQRARHTPLAFTRLMEKLLADYFAPASALINRHYEILSVQGPLVNYLEFPPGEMIKDLLAMARQGLRIRIRSACQRAMREGHTVTETDARVSRNGRYVPCTVTVRPITEPRDAEGLLLVVFQDLPALAPAQRSNRAARDDEESSIIEQLESELRATRDDLRSTIEELKSSNEELKASNEEIMSMNEELQSTNEELETSKEELQSLNEELTTVNSQLQDKVEELDAANGDLTNLMAATDIATLFLDTQLRIKRFTPPMNRLLSLLTSDIGRPFRDFAPRFRDDELLVDAERVLRTRAPSEKEVRADEDHRYLRRILPHLTEDQGIQGVVITFIDITARIASEAQARRLAAALRDSNDAIIVSDFDGRILEWNRGARRAYGYDEAAALEMNTRDIVPDADKESVSELGKRAARGEEIESFETRRLTRDGRVLTVWVTVTLLKDERGQCVALASTERDVTALRKSEAEITRLNEDLLRREAEKLAAAAAGEQRIRAILGATVDAIITINAEGTIETFNAAAESMFGYSAKEAIGRNISLLMPAPYRQNHSDYLKRYLQTRTPRLIGRLRDLRARRKDGTEFPMQLSVSEIPELGLFTGVVRDVTEQRALQEQIVRIATGEQHRIGRELHDSMQQELTGLGLLAQNLTDALSGPESAAQRALAAKLASGIAETNRHLRRLAKGLVPVAIDANGLMVALGDLAERTESDYGIKCRFVCPSAVHVADDGAALHLYRIAQEAVMNAIKHAHASTISIQLKQSDGFCTIQIRDDGVGIEEQASKADGLGLRIMEHRCGLIGGTFSVRRRKSGGTIIKCKVPMAPGK
jgi:two-component system CheB/CheR fusion protein